MCVCVYLRNILFSKQQIYLGPHVCLMRMFVLCLYVARSRVEREVQQLKSEWSEKSSGTLATDIYLVNKYLPIHVYAQKSDAWHSDDDTMNIEGQTTSSHLQLPL